MIVRWGLEELPGSSPSSASSGRFSSPARAGRLPVEVAGTWTEVPSDRIEDATAAARGTDGIVALGGGSAIDLAKAISVETGLPLVSVPTTYSGAEWTPTFGIRDHDKLMKGGGSGANLAGIVYEPKLTLDLPRRRRSARP